MLAKLEKGKCLWHTGDSKHFQLYNMHTHLIFVNFSLFFFFGSCSFIRFVRHGVQIKLFCSDSDQGIVFLWFRLVHSLCVSCSLSTRNNNINITTRNKVCSWLHFRRSSHNTLDASEHIEILLRTLAIQYSILDFGTAIRLLGLSMWIQFISFAVHSIRIPYDTGASCVFIHFNFVQFFSLFFGLAAALTRRVLYFFILPLLAVSLLNGYLIGFWPRCVSFRTQYSHFQYSC